MTTIQAPQHPIESARDALEERPLLAVDAALSALGATRGHRSAEESAEYLDVLARAVLAAGNCGEVEEGEDPVALMLKDRGCERLACAALLRLLAFDDTAFTEDRRLLAATTFFDRVLARSLYPEAKLSPKAQSFEKRDQLRTLVADHEEALIGHVRSLRSAEGMGAFRPVFGKLFNTAVNRVVVVPFLPEGMTRQTFDDLLGSCQGVLDSSDAGIVADAEALGDRCQELAEEGAALGTFYSEVLVTGFAETLTGLLRAHVSACGFSDPAELSLRLRPKQFPLGEPGTPATVRLDLSNCGRGQAQEVTVEIEGGGAIAYEETLHTIGLLAPGERLVEFHGTVVTPTAGGAPESDELMVWLRWRDADGEGHVVEDILTLEAQEGGRDWGRLALSEPYSLGPVTEREDFAGQEGAIRDLTKAVLQLGSARIQGEKRVGKTSLANAVRDPAAELSERPLCFIALESGDFNATTPEATVQRLGQMIAEQVRHTDQRLARLTVPDFSAGLSTLTEFFAGAQELAPELGFVVVLDEFDSLPHPELFRHGRLGDTLFQTLRSLGGKPNISLVLIGGERMKWVIAVHGQALNKFRVVKLDYFGEDQRSDYAELVRAPVDGQISFSDQAIELLHAETAGNPWISKLLLGQLFERAVQRRDSDVQVEDAAEAIEEALPKIGVESFQHFWDDAIRGEGEEQEHVSMMRRRVFLALGRCLESRGETTEEAVVRAAREFNVDERSARDIIRDLLERQILRHDTEHMLRCRVPVFERWLPKYGPAEIVLGAGDDEALLSRQRAIEEMRPTHTELAEIAARWKSYRGEDLRAEQIGEWLSQFGGPAEQRAVLPVLSGLRFYTRTGIANHLTDMHNWVGRELARAGYNYTFKGQQRSRDDLLVCALEGGGSGSSQLVKPYREENRIHRDCALDPGDVPAALAERTGQVRAVLILEDLICTGGTAKNRLRELHAEWTAEGPWPADVDIFLLTICGYEKGVAKVEAATEELEWPLTIWVGDSLGEADRCFGPHSSFFSEEEDRDRAKALCSEFGSRLSPRDPLGYRDSQAAICFEYRCPNNSLPVLWKEGTDWIPLFPRV
jgi:hypothetical protein